MTSFSVNKWYVKTTQFKLNYYRNREVDDSCIGNKSRTRNLIVIWQASEKKFFIGSENNNT